MESLPAAPRRIGKTLGDFRLVIFAAVLTLGLTFVLSFNLVWTSQVNVVVGEPAPDDVFAPQSLTYTSELLTNAAREQARNGVAAIDTPLNLSIGREQLAQANAVFAFIDTVRADSETTTEQKVEYLNGISNLALGDEIALDLLNMSQSDFDEVKEEIIGIVDSVMRQEIREDGLVSFQQTARRLTSLSLTASQSNVVTNLVWQFIVPTVFPDEETTAAARDEAAAAVEPVTRSVAKNQRIIRAGEIVTQQDKELLGELGLLRQDFSWRSVGSFFLVSFLAVLLVVLYWRLFHHNLWDNVRYLTVLGGLILLFSLVAKLMVTTPGNWPLLFPLAAMSMLLAVVFDLRFSVLVTLIVAAIFGFVAPDSLNFALYAGIGGLIAILTLRDAQRVVAYFRSGLLAAITGMLVLLVYALPEEPELLPLAMQFLYSLGNGLLSAAVTLVGFFVLGSVFGIITTLQLQDLSRLDHPLLQELLRRAPGTYHHSIMVANLAEQAAERVRANSTLVRVGAFYHDIGKMNRPPFFTENQEGVNPHDSLDPFTSAQIIIEHVPDGLELAKRYRLALQIQDFIAEHHGQRIVKGFYHKACALAGDEADEVDKEQFRYPGPRPRSRESGIVMLADAIEATSSAVHPNTPAAIEKLVQTIVDEDMMEGQLNKSGLSLGDIESIRASFIETLKGRYHVRVKYPGNELLEAGPTEVTALPATVSDRAESVVEPVNEPFLPQEAEAEA